MELKEYFDDILEEFDLCESKMEKLQLVLEYGKDLGEFPSTSKIRDNEVPGCTSNVFIDVSKNKSDGSIEFSACSDALIVGGYIAILFDGLNGRTAKEIYDSKDLVYEFTKKAGIRESLTPTRANAFSNILEMIFNKVEKFI